MNRSFRSPEIGKTGSLRLKNNRDDDLALFREMRRREKEQSNLLILQNSDDFNAHLGPLGSSPVFNIPSSTSAKTGPDDFLNSDNDKNDYEWLLTPPGTPLFPSLETEHNKAVKSQHGTPKARPTALTSRLSNSHTEPASRNNSSSSSRQPPSSSHGLNTSSSSLRRPSSSGGSRPSTPTSRPTLSTSTSNRSQAKPSTRSSTPTSRTTSSLSKSTVVPPTRSSTPTTTRPTIRSSTPTRAPGPTGPAPKPVSRAPTPSRRPTDGKTTAIPTQKPSKNPAPPRSSSPSVRPKMWKPSEMPGFSLEAPPNLRTSINDRPPSATRGRPGPASSRSSSVEPVSNGRARRQSCSPSRGRPPNGIMRSSGSSVPVPASSRLHAKANDSVSPGLVGSKMVERTVNMRKLMPPKQNGKHSPVHSLSGKSMLSPDTSGFGRNLSKKSLDMAIRHMDIRRTIPGNLRPLMTNIPASSLYSVRSGPSNRRTLSVSDSPLGTSSNASSELSVNNNAHYMDGNEVDDDISSDKGIRSPSSSHGR